MQTYLLAFVLTSFFGPDIQCSAAGRMVWQPLSKLRNQMVQHFLHHNLSRTMRDWIMENIDHHRVSMLTMLAMMVMNLCVEKNFCIHWHLSPQVFHFKQIPRIAIPRNLWLKFSRNRRGMDQRNLPLSCHLPEHRTFRPVFGRYFPAFGNIWFQFIDEISYVSVKF